MGDLGYVELDLDSPWLQVLRHVSQYPEPAPVWLTKREAADRARVSVRTIEQWIHDGLLRSAGGRGTTRIRPEWVDECLEELARRRRRSA